MGRFEQIYEEHREAIRADYGPTMNAFEAAAASGREAELEGELDALFTSQNDSPTPDATLISATFLRVTVAV
jgi:translation initiation factor 2 alpha subunit (eIF-2alpha)